MIRIIYTNIGMIIGERTTPSNLDCQAVKNPRLLTIQQGAKPGEPIQFNLLEMLGQPKGMECGKDFMSIDINDEVIINAYTQVTTGLILPRDNVVQMRPQ